MGQADYYLHGGWNVICDRCGFKRKNTEVRREWDGLMVCADTCWEQDHPQKYIRVVEGPIAPPFVRTDPTPTYVAVCYIYATAAYAGLGEAGCMQAGLASPSYAFLLAVKNASLG